MRRNNEAVERHNVPSKKFMEKAQKVLAAPARSRA